MTDTDDATVVLDLDGTLVDSLYVHVTTWAESFAAAGRPQPMWRIHRAIGLGSDRLVAHLLGGPPDADLRAQLVDGHSSRFLDRAGDLAPTRGATDLLADLADREVPTVVATSAGGEERKALMAALGDPDIPVTDASSADDSKPGPAPLRQAAADLPRSPSTMMVGDTTWDGHAALRAGMRFVGVRCGGFGTAELREAGADLVVDDPAGLIGLL
jgi:phosphoglycolate phosphatase-like HAD superfamily hydrolase